jgi:hypothetical protein
MVGRVQRGLRRRLSPATDVEVATAEVKDRIRLIDAAPPMLEARMGQKVRLLVPYRLMDHTEHAESYVLTLEVRVDDGNWSVLRQEHETSVARRVLEGELAQSLRMTRPRHQVRYRVKVAYDVRKRGSGQPILIDRKEVAGALEVRAAESAGNGAIALGTVG